LVDKASPSSSWIKGETVGEAGGGDEHVGHAAVCAGDAPDQEAVGSLKWKAGHSPQGAVEAHTGNEVE